jgi:hypothetical protein
MISETGFLSLGEETRSGDVETPSDSKIKGENMRAVGSIGTH